MSYITCGKRKGSPKVNVEVCRRKCKYADQCKSYKDYLNIAQALPAARATVRNHRIAP
jgi:hypothetical protein